MTDLKAEYAQPAVESESTGMTWRYCGRWNKMLAKPISPLSEDEARARHERGELYIFSTREDGAISLVLARRSGVTSFAHRSGVVVGWRITSG